MIASETARNIIESNGLKQRWVLEQMNTVDPDLNMTPVKMSAMLSGKRSMTADELIAFCKATRTDPSVFIPQHSA